MSISALKVSKNLQKHFSLPVKQFHSATSVRPYQVASRTLPAAYRTQNNRQCVQSYPLQTRHGLVRAQSSPMSSTATSDPAIGDILDFWFSLDATGWFQESSKYDKVITERFSHLVEKARLTDELDETWTSTPAGSLAIIILLDQFTRNIFREGNHADPGLSWSGDAKALDIATWSISKGFDKQIQEEHSSSKMLGVDYRMFFYLPLMHAETLAPQLACVALYESMQKDCEITRLKRLQEGKEETQQEKELREYLDMAVPFAEKHRNCIAALGRFPKRNKPLGRENTAKEDAWLEKYPMGF